MGQEIIRIDLNGVNAYLWKEQNAYMLVDTGGYMLIDGMKGGLDNRREQLEEALTKNGCCKENLQLIVVTHADIDHVMNAAYLSKKYEAPIAIHEAEAEEVKKPTYEYAMKSFHYRALSMKIISKLMHGLFERVTRKSLEDFESFTPDIVLHDGDSLEQYGFHAKVIHLPGHTPGSIGIWDFQKEMLVGDTFICNNKLEIAMNAWDFKMVRESAEKVRQLGVLKIYPGHGEPCTFEK